MFRGIIILLCLCGGLLAQTNIAVIDFTGKNVSAEEASALTDRLRIELFKTKKFTVIERERMDTILKEQGFQLSDCTDDACIVEMGQLVGVEQIVAGSVSRVGRVYSIAARIIGVEKGDLVNIATFDHEGEIGDLLKFGMQNIALQLAGLTPPPTTTPPPQPQLPPKVASKNLRLGLLFGYGASRVWGDDISKKLALHPANSGGIIALFRLQKQLFLRTEMLLTRKGWTENYTGLTGDDVEHTIDLDYLQIPFLVQFNLPVASGTEMFFLGGATAGFLTRAKESFKVNGKTYGPTMDIKKEIRAGESGMLFGCGLEFKKRLILEMRVDMSITPNDGTVSDPSQAPDRKNSFAAFMLGICF